MLSGDDKRPRFEATALPFADSVYRMALRLARNRDDANDLVQETFLRAFRTFENFRLGTNCKAWLLTILYSVFVNRYRKKIREPRMVSLDALEQDFNESLADERSSDPTDSLVWTDPEIEKALDSLSESFRDAVLLVDVEELTYEEAAATLNCPVGTVRSRLFRARKLLFVALRGAARRAGYGKGEGQA